MPHKPLSHRPFPKVRTPDNRPNSAQRGYSWKWQQARAAYLAQHPLCVECEKEGRLVPAVVVDHVTPHRGDYVLFWDSEHNWQSLCSLHHNQKTARERVG
jgi:5-methylcytosine-specific restriction enzyme A